MITGIYIENFKGIGKSGIKLDLAPVTLMFGKNSAGKSTIFHAFLYAHEVLFNHNLNADRTTLGGNSVDLGGFHTFVHDHDPKNQVTITLELDLASAKLDEVWRIAESLVGVDENVVDLSALGTDVWSGAVSFAIAWDPVKCLPFVTRFAVDIDKEAILNIWCDAPGDKVLSKVNYRHPIFRWPNVEELADQDSAGVLDSLYSPFQTITDQWFWNSAFDFDSEILEEKADFGTGNLELLEGSGLNELRVIEDSGVRGTVQWFYSYDTEQQKAILEAALFYAGDEWSREEAEEDWRDQKRLNDLDAYVGIEILDQADALPYFDRPLQLLIAPATETGTRDLIRDVISRLALGPTKLLASELDNFRHIGPLRDIPTRSFQSILSPDPARWSSGLAAWDFLSKTDNEFVEKVSSWLSDTDRLNTGYSLIRKIYKELDTYGWIMRILEQDNPLDDLPLALEGLADLPVLNRLILCDEQSQVEIDPQDIAIGITQLVPVVVAALDKHSGISLIEQPELHNHPAVEVGLGDLFIEAVGNEHQSCRFLIETHGEHLLLRILRRIRETTAQKVVTQREFKANRVAIYVFEKVAGATSVRRIEVDIEGEFIQPWPDDFFDIDFKERFN